MVPKKKFVIFRLSEIASEAIIRPKTLLYSAVLSKQNFNAGCCTSYREVVITVDCMRVTQQLHMGRYAPHVRAAKFISETKKKSLASFSRPHPALGTRVLIQYSIIVDWNLACQDQQLNIVLRANVFVNASRAGTCFVTVKEWPSKWLKILMQHCLFP